MNKIKIRWSQICNVLISSYHLMSVMHENVLHLLNHSQFILIVILIGQQDTQIMQCSKRLLKLLLPVYVSSWFQQTSFYSKPNLSIPEYHLISYFWTVAFSGLTPFFLSTVKFYFSISANQSLLPSMYIWAVCYFFPGSSLAA